MSLHIARSAPPPPRIEPSPAHRVLQVILALAGWGLFAWWWWIVMRRVSRDEITFTLVFVSVSLVVVVGVTVYWIAHNLGIFKRKGPRLNNRVVPEDYVQDELDRTLRFEGGLDQIRRAPVVAIKLDDKTKTYMARSARATHSGGEAVAS